MFWKASLITALTSLLLVGCSSANDENQKVTLDFWTTTTENETAAVLEVVKKFEEKYPSVKIKVKEVEFAKAGNQFKTATLLNEAPDILRSDIGWTTELADLGVLLPLDHKVSQEDKKDYFQSAFRYNEYQGHIYGIPMVTDSPALLYNKRILKEAGYDSPPKSMNELLTVAKKITNKNQYGIFISPDSYYALPYVWAFGGGMISDNNEIQIDNEGSINGINFMMQLINQKVSQPYPTFDNWNEVMMNDFKAGKVAMIINGPWATSDILSSEEFKDSGNLGVAPVPSGPGGQGSPVGGHNLVISKYTEAPDEAYQFIDFLNSKENQVYFAENLGNLPTRQSAYEDEDLLNNEVFQGFKSQLEVATSRPIIPEGSLLFGDFTTNLSQILSKEISVKEGLKNVSESWDYLIN